MKKVRFVDKKNNVTIDDVNVGNLGTKIFPLCKDINEMNSVVRWCNVHNVGDKFSHDLFEVEITSIK